MSKRKKKQPRARKPTKRSAKSSVTKRKKSKVIQRESRSAAAKKGWETRRKRAAIIRDAVRHIRETGKASDLKELRSLLGLKRGTIKQIETANELAGVTDKLLDAYRHLSKISSKRAKSNWQKKIDRFEKQREKLEVQNRHDIERLERLTASVITQKKRHIARDAGVDAVRAGIAKQLEETVKVSPKLIPTLVKHLYEDMVDWGFDEQIDEREIWEIFEEGGGTP